MYFLNKSSSNQISHKILQSVNQITPEILISIKTIVYTYTQRASQLHFAVTEYLRSRACMHHREPKKKKKIE